MNVYLKKLAVPLCITMVIAGCIIWIILQNLYKNKGSIAEVRVSGETIMRLDLSENTRIKLNGEEGIDIIIVVENGGIYVEHSDCPDKICEKKGRITDTGDSIVCLPAHTVIEVIKE